MTLGAWAVFAGCATGPRDQPGGEPLGVSAETLEWSQVTRLTSSTPADNAWFGTGVAIDGDVAVVGAYRENADRGAAHVFHREEGGAYGWGEVGRLTASDGSTFDEFGRSVGVSGDTVLVGAAGADPDPNGTPPDPGVGYIFQRDQGGPDAWGQVAQLVMPLGGVVRLGLAATIEGDIAVLGGGTQTSPGRAVLFARDQDGANAWGYVTNLAGPSGMASFFGTALDMDGDRVIVGARGSEAAYIFERNAGGPDAWGLIATLMANDTHSSNDFASSVTISGDTAIVGSPNSEINNERNGALSTSTNVIRTGPTPGAR